MISKLVHLLDHRHVSCCQYIEHFKTQENKNDFLQNNYFATGILVNIKNIAAPCYPCKSCVARDRLDIND